MPSELSRKLLFLEELSRFELVFGFEYFWINFIILTIHLSSNHKEHHESQQKTKPNKKKNPESKKSEYIYMYIYLYIDIKYFDLKV